jgi:GT2 family glycosyltransferase
MPSVSVVIPHFNGVPILDACLKSLGQCDASEIEIIVVDNGSSDNSIAHIEAHYPHVRIFANKTNRGFAGGVNDGILQANGNYILILNNDTTHEPNWISPLVTAMESDDTIAAVQPKLLSAKNPDTFDYSGAAGGLMDRFGFPFALGRIFTNMEKDTGQYNTPTDIFWASGTALLVRKTALDVVGLLDEDFFAHMEEIDLCWRFKNHGYKIINEPKSIVYHHSGWTLPPDKYLKKYLNHRNNLVMLLKNLPATALVTMFPIRVFLEFVALGFSLLIRDWKRVIAIIHALGWVFVHLPSIWRKRHQAMKTVQKENVRKSLASTYQGSVFFDYFLRQKKTSNALNL